MQPKSQLSSTLKDRESLPTPHEEAPAIALQVLLLAQEEVIDSANGEHHRRPQKISLPCDL